MPCAALASCHAQPGLGVMAMTVAVAVAVAAALVGVDVGETAVGRMVGAATDTAAATAVGEASLFIAVIIA